MKRRALALLLAGLAPSVAHAQPTEYRPIDQVINDLNATLTTVTTDHLIPAGLSLLYITAAFQFFWLIVNFLKKDGPLQDLFLTILLYAAWISFLVTTLRNWYNPSYPTINNLFRAAMSAAVQFSGLPGLDTSALVKEVLYFYSVVQEAYGGWGLVAIIGLSNNNLPASLALWAILLTFLFTVARFVLVLVEAKFVTAYMALMSGFAGNSFTIAIFEKGMLAVVSLVIQFLLMGIILGTLHNLCNLFANEFLLLYARGNAAGTPDTVYYLYGTALAGIVLMYLSIKMPKSLSDHLRMANLNLSRLLGD